MTDLPENNALEQTAIPNRSTGERLASMETALPIAVRQLEQYREEIKSIETKLDEAENEIRELKRWKFTVGWGAGIIAVVFVGVTGLSWLELREKAKEAANNAVEEQIGVDVTQRISEADIIAKSLLANDNDMTEKIRKETRPIELRIVELLTRSHVSESRLQSIEVQLRP